MYNPVIKLFISDNISIRLFSKVHASLILPLECEIDYTWSDDKEYFKKEEYIDYDI